MVDIMVGQLLRRLAEDELQCGGGPYLLAVTGDHSTPVEFGDHSHEPVPFAAAHVRDVVSGWLAGQLSWAPAAAPPAQNCLYRPPWDSNPRPRGAFRCGDAGVTGITVVRGCTLSLKAARSTKLS